MGIDQNTFADLTKWVTQTLGCKTSDHEHLRNNDSATSSDAVGGVPTDDERAEWRCRLSKYCDNFQKRRCTSSQSYKKWNDAGYSRPPSQWIAYQQLNFRWKSNVPILVNIPAQAGFGKSELINAWRLQMKLADEYWEAIAPSGVAAVQINGKTLHGLIRMDGTCASFLAPNSEQANELKNMQGLIIDEVGMISEPVFKELIRILQAYPLKRERRHRIPPKRAIPMFGYRDVILSGDLRQLPPADGKLPLFATHYYHNLFEFFVLAEDRRHEREPAMQTLKELLAWGGSSKRNKMPLPIYVHIHTYTYIYI